jgi:hypothetical protein
MTVSKLIEELQKYPKDTRVVVRGYEGGVDDVGYLEDTYISLNENTAWYYGKREVTDDPKDVAAIKLCGG